MSSLKGQIDRWKENTPCIVYTKHGVFSQIEDKSFNKRVVETKGCDGMVQEQ